MIGMTISYRGWAQVRMLAFGLLLPHDSDRWRYYKYRHEDILNCSHLFLGSRINSTKLQWELCQYHVWERIIELRNHSQFQDNPIKYLKSMLAKLGV